MQKRLFHLRRPNFTGRAGIRFQAVIALLVLFVTVSFFFHLYASGFFSNEEGCWLFGSSEHIDSSIVQKAVAELQAKVGKGMEEMETTYREDTQLVLEEALSKLKLERTKYSNLLLEVATSLETVSSLLKHTSHSGLPSSKLSHRGPIIFRHEPIESQRRNQGKGQHGVRKVNSPGDDEREEGEWAEDEGKAEMDPAVDFFETEEIRKYIKPKVNRLGKKNIMGANATYGAIGHACVSRKYDLEQYMDYDVGEYCNDDWPLAQRLMIHGCDPLPRRRCYARGPKTYDKPLQTNVSLWTVPQDRNVRWDNYICKSFSCLSGKNRKGFFKCGECFDLDGHEKPKWMQITDNSTEADFLIEDVLMLKPGEIRIGLDFSVGVGTFAARMRERNITIASATLNLGAPFNEIIALRGLLPLYLTVNQRLPFFDNTLDMVHTTLFLDGWIDQQLLDFIIFDWDRVLRPGGLMWIDRFFCNKTDMDDYLYYFEQLRYKKRKWVVTPKVDKDGDELWFSAVLEKPDRPF